MSLSTVLQANARNEDWNKVYFHDVNCLNLNVANSPNIKGVVRTDSDVLVNSDFVMTTGNGTLFDRQSIVSSWISSSSNHKFYNVTGSIEYTGVDTPVVGLSSLFTINITLPFGTQMIYPHTPSGTIMPSAVSAFVSTSTGPSYSVGSGIANKNSSSKVELLIPINGNISAPDAGRRLQVSFSFTYQVIDPV